MTALMLVPMLAFGQRLSESEREILTFQDQRTLGGGKLLTYLANPDAHLRAKALVALANIQDTGTVSVVVPLLRDPEASVRTRAAFALGQIGSRSSQDSLLIRLQAENDTTAIAYILEALGKVGDENALDRVIEYSNEGGSDFLASEQALAVARFAMRGIKNERSIWFCFDLTKKKNPEVRWKALFALWRTAPHGLIDIEIAKREEDLAGLMRDPSADVRMNLATLLGRTNSSYARDLLLSFVQADRKQPHWQVEVPLVRSLGSLATSNPELVEGITEYLISPNDHVKIAALQTLSGLGRQTIDASGDTTRLLGALIELAKTKNPSAELTRGEAFVALAKLYPSEFPRRVSYADQNLTVRERTKVIEALSYVPSGRGLSIMFQALDDPNVRIAMSAWDFIRRLLTPPTLARIRSGDQEWGDARGTLYRKTLNALSRHDMAITHLVSNALADTVFFNVFKGTAYSDTLILGLRDAYDKLSSPDDVEAMQATVIAMGRIGDPRFVPALEKGLNDPDRTVALGAAGALNQITKKDYSSRIPQSSKPIHTDYDWQTLESVSPASRAVVKTGKGIIIVQLLKDEAPFTVLNFVKLVRKGFYNGLLFHRVVPNFVIQGGDPRGDGWGGPGFAMRSEYSLARFTRGGVGIASACKDTEGCQFFITHLPTPHLDGRFTVFARVVEGQEVADRIQVGDSIERITLE